MENLKNMVVRQNALAGITSVDEVERVARCLSSRLETKE
jgi:hypothetical protein